MRAIVVHSLGAPDVLRTGHRPVPEPGPGEVLVRIHAIGVNFSDTERRRGVYDPPALPWTPGNEAAGVVEALGPGTDPAWNGRRVAFWAMRTSGCYAEYATVSAAALFHLRDEVDFATGAALPAQGLTAYGLAHASTALPAGATALVHAAAGGVGTLLVQMLARRGVRVFGTASAAKLPLVEAAGAAPHALRARSGRAVAQATGGRGVDAVFDSVGRDTQEASLAALALYGRLVWFGDSSGPPDPVQPDALYPRNLQVTRVLARRRSAGALGGRASRAAGVDGVRRAPGDDRPDLSPGRRRRSAPAAGGTGDAWQGDPGSGRLRSV